MFEGSGSGEREDNYAPTEGIKLLPMLICNVSYAISAARPSAESCAYHVLRIVRRAFEGTRYRWGWRWRVDGGLVERVDAGGRAGRGDRSLPKKQRIEPYARLTSRWTAGLFKHKNNICVAEGNTATRGLCS